MTTLDRRSAARSALGLPPDATIDEVVAAHRRLVFEVHPDRIPDPELRPAAEERLKEINAARDLLLQPEPMVPQPAAAPEVRVAPAYLAPARVPTRAEGPMWPVYVLVAALMLVGLTMFGFGMARGAWNSDRTPYHSGFGPFSLNGHDGTQTATATKF